MAEDAAEARPQARHVERARRVVARERDILVTVKLKSNPTAAALRKQVIAVTSERNEARATADAADAHVLRKRRARVVIEQDALLAAMRAHEHKEELLAAMAMLRQRSTETPEQTRLRLQQEPAQCPPSHRLLA